MEIKTKINKWDLIKPQSFCTAKDTINNMKRQPSEWRKYLQMKQRTKDLSPKYTNSSWTSISKKQTIQFKNGQDFPGGTVVKNPSANSVDIGSSPGPGRSPMLWSS